MVIDLSVLGHRRILEVAGAFRPMIVPSHIVGRQVDERVCTRMVASWVAFPIQARTQTRVHVAVTALLRHGVAAHTGSIVSVEVLCDPWAHGVLAGVTIEAHIAGAALVIVRMESREDTPATVHAGTFHLGAEARLL